MEGNKVTIIFVDLGSGNDRTSQIPPDVFYNGFWITIVWFGVDIEAFFVFPVTLRFCLFKGRVDLFFHFIEQSGTEGIPEEGIIKVD